MSLAFYVNESDLKSDSCPSSSLCPDNSPIILFNYLSLPFYFF